ncbi:MAG: DUF192 domain-containing protein [Patescibacteria group bacterium]
MNKRRWIFVLTLLVTLIVIVYVFIFAQVGETSQQSLAIARVQFSTGHEILVEVADALSEQVQGLSFRQGLEDDKGMLFTYDEKDERLFWMKDMLFSIDIIWIVDSVIVGVEREVPPTGVNETPKIYVSPVDVDMVLEVPAGWMSLQGIEVGAHIKVTDVRE